MKENLKYLLFAILCIVSILLAFEIIGWSLTGLLILMEHWYLAFFILGCLIAIFIMRLLGRLLAGLISLLYSRILNNAIRKIVKWILIILAWGRLGLLIYITFAALDMNTTKNIFVAICTILSGSVIAWHLHSHLDHTDKSIKEIRAYINSLDL